MLLRFTTRHLLRHWRMNLVVLAGLMLTSAFLAGLPMYATAIAGRSLRQTLADAPPAGKNILVQGSGLNDDLYSQMSNALGDLLRERVEVREAEMAGLSAIFKADADDNTERPFDESLTLHAYSFSNLDDNITVVEGRLPQHLPPEPNQGSSLAEAVIGLPASQDLNLTLAQGNQLALMHLGVGDQLRSASGALRVNIVGIVKPADPESDVWWGDLTPFAFSRIDNGSFQPDTAVPSLLMPPQSLDAHFPGYTYHWRVLTDIAQINVDNMATVRGQLKSLEASLQSNLARLDTSLLEIFDQYMAELAIARVSLFLLAVQSLVFVLYTIAMISLFSLDRMRGEVASLIGRGFSSRQITQIFALQALCLALLAAPVGPFLAQAVLSAWGRATDTAVLSTIPADSWRLALLALGFAWLIIVASVYWAARGNIVEWQRHLTRPPQLAGWQKVYLDFFLLILGGLLYWQLAETGSFVAGTGDPTQRAAGVADPLLLLGPSLLLIAVALVFLRLFPYLLRLAAWWAGRRPDLILPFGLARLARDPVGPSRVVLLISLAAGLTLFASSLSNSLTTRQKEIAHYLSGADLRVEIPNGAQAAEYQAVAGSPGVVAASPVYRNRSRWAPQLGREATLLAVDPATFPQVTRFAPDITNLTLAGVMPALVVDDPNDDAIPAVFSFDAYPQDKQVGDHVTYVVGQYKVAFEVRGLIRNFPAVAGPFFVTNLAAVEKAVDLDSLTVPWDGSKEIWLSVDPAQHEALVSNFLGRMPGEIEAIVADAQRQERALQSNLIALETLAAFNLNAGTLAVLSVAIFLLVHYFAAHQRLYEFSLLRAMGLSTRQLLSLLSLEGIIMMVLGLLAGSGLGYGLAQMMRPFLSRTLTVALGGDALHRVLLDWFEVSGLYILLIGFYALALLLLLLLLLRGGIHRALRMGEE